VVEAEQLVLAHKGAVLLDDGVQLGASSRDLKIIRAVALTLMMLARAAVLLSATQSC
jgi:hypothetical protein